MEINQIYAIIENAIEDSESFTCIADDCINGELTNNNNIWTCSKCGEQFTDDDIAEYIEDKVYELSF